MNEPHTANCPSTGHGSVGYLALVCLVASLGGLLFGFDTAVISGAVGMVESLFALSKLQVGWFTSSALLGCILGAIPAGALGDRFGRRPCLIVAAACFFLSALCSTIPPTFAVLIPARLLGGIGVGMASVLAPLYISEFAPPRLRGRLVALYQLSIVIGILAAYFCNWWLVGFAQSNPQAFGAKGWLHWVMVDQVWRAMFGAEMIPAALFFLLLFIVPESPRWLIKAGFQEKGVSILARISGHETAQAELRDIQNSLDREEGTLAELFRPGLRRALLVGVGLSFFGQLTGVNIVVYYGPDILKQAGFSLGSALQYQVALGIINLIFTLVAIWKIDSWGRRPLLIGGMSAVSVTLGLAGLLFALNVTGGILIVAVLCLYMGCVAVSICGVIWVLTPEIFPNRMRARAVSIATFTNWSTNALSIEFLFPLYVAQFGMETGFFTFAGICLLAVIFFYRTVPETKGKSLEEIEQHWMGN